MLRTALDKRMSSQIVCGDSEILRGGKAKKFEEIQQISSNNFVYLMKLDKSETVSFKLLEFCFQHKKIRKNEFR